jgi:Tol biopolymer transport system component
VSRARLHLGDGQFQWLGNERLVYTDELRPHIVFVRVPRLRVERRLLVRGDGLTISPDGTRAAYRGLGQSGDLFVRDLSSGRTLRLAKSVALGFLWHRTGKLIAFAKSRPDPAELFFIEIFVADSRGGEVRLLTSRGEDELNSWSPHGEYVIYQGDHGTEYRPLGGGAARRLPTDYAWAQDDSTVAVSVGPDSWFDVYNPADDRAALYLLDPTTGEVTLLTQRE